MIAQLHPHVAARVHADSFQAFRLSAYVGGIRTSYTVAIAPSISPVRIERDNPSRVPVRQRRQEYRVYDGKDRSVRPNAQRQREHRRHSKATAAPQFSECIQDILRQKIHLDLDGNAISLHIASQRPFRISGKQPVFSELEFQALGFSSPLVRIRTPVSGFAQSPGSCAHPAGDWPSRHAMQYIQTIEYRRPSSSTGHEV
jgi:hypothetical protein